MAWTLGEGVGETVGYRVRLDNRVSTATRIEVVTEGIFTHMILGDPGLEGVAAVIFDEFHERSLDADFGLALACDSQALLRPDLRLLVMSATLDGARIAERLAGAPVIESQGRAFPVDTRYLGRGPHEPLDSQVAKAIRRAVRVETGGVLAFLPGQGEILRTLRRLLDEPLGANIDVYPLYGALDVADQDLAAAPSPPGRRKVVLATSIAETSLTLEGVRVVIDSGLARGAHWHGASGLSRLRTRRASRASADQRRGRAGRTAPGVCWRLWDEAETRALPPFDPPEILTSDLSRLALDLAKWGAPTAEGLVFLDPPPPKALAEGRHLLEELGALDAIGVLTPHGEALSRIPLTPRLAHMVVVGARAGMARRAALLAAVVSERGLGGRDADIGVRADALSRGAGPRTKGTLAMVDRWVSLAGSEGRARRLSDGLLVAMAFPERVAKGRGERGQFQMANGRGARLDAVDPLASAPWLAIADLGGAAETDRILLAAALDIERLRAEAPERFRTEDRIIETPGGARRARRFLELGELTVETQDLASIDPALIVKALMTELSQGGLGTLPWGPASMNLRARLTFLGLRDKAWPEVTDEALLARLEDWLSPVLTARPSLRNLTDSDLASAIQSLIPPGLYSRFETQAPVVWMSPAGTEHPVDYAAEGGPRVDVRVQALFGLTVHPTLPGGTPLVLALLSPAQRPIQVTRDLPRFWSGAWIDVRKEMRGRYPKHPWPENPAEAPPTLRAKPRL
jgi:ATP-dependent helicase HrpB